MADESTLAATSSILQYLAVNIGGAPLQTAQPIILPGANSPAKSALEREIAALVARIQTLEAKATTINNHTLPDTPNETGAPSAFADVLTGGPKRPNLKGSSIRNQYGNSSTRDNPSGERAQKLPKLSNDELIETLQQEIVDQAEQIKHGMIQQNAIKAQMEEQAEHQKHLINQFEAKRVASLERELKKHQQANEAFQKALREIGEIITAVARGDLSKKVQIHSVEMDPEITTFKRVINTMMDQLQIFSSEVSRVAREVGTEGILGGQAQISGVDGTWKELTDNVNIMAQNLTDQVREIASVTTAVAHGDLTQKIERPAQGEILQLQQTINTMVDQLRTFAAEVTRVARDVGTEGILGGQAEIEGVKGMWNTLTVNVNAMANNLTTQVRDIAMVTTAVAKGDLTQKVQAECKGEILQLKATINSMVDQLQQFAREVTKIAREVGTEGKLGGQATVHDVEGTWRDLTENVNGMAMNLTLQVREIAKVTTAVAKGDLTKKINVEAQGEIASMKDTINTMVDRLGTFAFEVSKVAREVGTDGTLGGQAQVDNVEGKWKDLTENVNTMASNLTSQVRGISTVTQAIANGDMSQKIEVEAAGEILVLKETINNMVDRLSIFSNEVQRVAKDVGVDGKMGGQADVAGIGGRWKEITTDVNTMAMNLTAQVRAFGDITNAATDGDFTKLITVEASGEMDELKRKINQMVFNLRDSIQRNTAAREAAEFANRTKSEFLANMSHEIRTPSDDGLATTLETVDSVPVIDMMQLLVLLMWTCLQLTGKRKNPIFDMVFPNTSILAGVLSSCSINFCPGLFEVLQAPTAPTLEWFKSLPSDFTKRWGIYIIVLEKHLCTPRVYLGSGTNAALGVSKRMANYVNRTVLPVFVDAALKEGYVITHKGLILWAPIPSARDVPIRRALFLVLEATMCFVLWIVKTKVGGTFYSFGLRPLCLWDVIKLPFSGICSHSPLIEGMYGDFSLSAEDLETLDKQRKQNAAEYNAKYHAEWYEKMKVKAPEERRAVNRETYKVRYDKDPTKVLTKNRKLFDKNIATKKYFCVPCGYPAAHQKNLDAHLLTKRHLNTVNPGPLKPRARNQNHRDDNIAKKKYYCAICPYNAVHKQNLDTHLNSAKHRKKVLESESSSGSS